MATKKLGLRPIKFYYDNLSQPCRSVEIFLKVARIPYMGKFIHVAAGENREDEFAKVNPLNKVPVIDDDGFVLFESVAILRYLCRERNVPDHWYPKESRGQALVDQYLEWQHTNTRIACATYAWTTFFLPLLTSKKPREEREAKARGDVERVMNEFENYWLKNKPFLAGKEISIADLVAVSEIEQLKLTDVDPREGRPRLAIWLESVRSLTQPHYDTVHSHLYEIVKEKHSPDIAAKL